MRAGLLIPIVCVTLWSVSSWASPETASIKITRCSRGPKGADLNACTVVSQGKVQLRFRESVAELSSDQDRNSEVFSKSADGLEFTVSTWLKTTILREGKAVRLRKPQPVISIEVRRGGGTEVYRTELPYLSASSDPFSVNSTFLTDAPGSQYFV